MAITPLAFDPPTGWNDSTRFPTYEGSEAQVRADMQELYDQTRDYINNTLSPVVDNASTKANKAVLLPNSAGMKYIRLGSDNVLETSTNGNTWSDANAGTIDAATKTSLTGVLAGDGSTVGVKPVDIVATPGSDNLITSNAVWGGLRDKLDGIFISSTDDPAEAFEIAYLSNEVILRHERIPGTNNYAYLRPAYIGESKTDTYRMAVCWYYGRLASFTTRMSAVRVGNRASSSDPWTYTYSWGAYTETQSTVLTGTPSSGVTTIGASYNVLNEIELETNNTYIITANVAASSSASGSLGIQLRNQTDSEVLCQSRATLNAGGGVVATALIQTTGFGPKTIAVRAAQNSGADVGISVNTLTAVCLTPY